MAVRSGFASQGPGRHPEARRPEPRATPSLPASPGYAKNQFPRHRLCFCYFDSSALILSFARYGSRSTRAISAKAISRSVATIMLRRVHLLLTAAFLLVTLTSEPFTSAVRACTTQSSNSRGKADAAFF